MREFAILITMQVSFAYTCICQVSIPLKDASPAGSPIRISGTVSFRDDKTAALQYTYEINGFVTNLSNKRIVLTMIHVSATGVGAPSLDHTVAVDRFFDSDDLNPNGIEGISHTPIQFGPTVSRRSTPVDINPSATAELIFLQFADGSTWGDAAAGRQQLSLRTETLRELRRLGQILDRQGDLGLKDELVRTDEFQFPTIYSLVMVCTSRPAFCLADGLRNMIKEADKHEVEMSLAKTPSGGAGRVLYG